MIPRQVFSDFIQSLLSKDGETQQKAAPLQRYSLECIESESALVGVLPQLAGIPIYPFEEINGVSDRSYKSFTRNARDHREFKPIGSHT